MEPLDDQPGGQPQEQHPAIEVPDTGVSEVDEVLGTLTDLEQRPVAEHVGVFEHAHQQLRRVLDGSSTGSAPAPDAGQHGG